MYLWYYLYRTFVRIKLHIGDLSMSMNKLRKKEKLYMNITVTENIKVTHHAIERHRQRNILGDADNNLIAQDIEYKIRRSRLINIKDGKELREYYGSIFVCKREKINELAYQLVVITELLSTFKKLENFGESYI